MFLGKPILMGVEGDAGKIIGDANAGALFEPENAESLVSAIQEVLEEGEGGLKACGERSHSYYFNYLSLRSGVDQFVKVFEEVSKN